MIEVKWKKLDENARIPVRAKPGDSGADICALQKGYIAPGKSKLIKTGISAEIPIGYEIQVRSRSGLAAKNGLFVLNSPGTVDAGYRGDIGVILFNTSKKVFTYKAGDRVAQLVICQLPEYKSIEVDYLSETERGDGGFGHTGV